MVKSTLSFRLVQGEMRCREDKDIIRDIICSTPLSSAFNINRKKTKKIINKRNFTKNKLFSISPIFLLGAVDGGVLSSQGIFWDAFLKYIFPYMLDIAKVFCAIKIAQAFYQEKRGGRDDSTGISAMVQYGKWYLLFWGLPLIVELFDQIGATMFNDLKGGE